MMIVLLCSMCNGDDIDNNFAWYICNNTNEKLSVVGSELIFYQYISPGDTLLLNVKSVEKDEDVIDFSSLYSLQYGRYTDVLLLDSLRRVIKRWSIYDSIMDSRHIMLEENWLDYRHQTGWRGWIYVISKEDLSIYKDAREV